MSQSEVRTMKRRGAVEGRRVAEEVIARMTSLKILTAADEDAAIADAVDKVQESARQRRAEGISERAAKQFYLSAIAACVDRFHEFQERLSRPDGEEFALSLLPKH